MNDALVILFLIVLMAGLSSVSSEIKYGDAQVEDLLPKDESKNR